VTDDDDEKGDFVDAEEERAPAAAAGGDGGDGDENERRLNGLLNECIILLRAVTALHSLHHLIKPPPILPSGLGSIVD